MKILAIETSCDETAIAILECGGDEHATSFKILGNALLSQIEIHREYGGVFPAIAKREHAKNLVPLLEAALAEAELLHEGTQAIPEQLRTRISTILEREPDLDAAFFASLSEMETPDIAAIAVTAGPGLEPALWVGINFAKALSLLWNKPLVAVNHMEGHLLAALAETTDDTLQIQRIRMPVLALLISGGHTELVLMKSWPGDPSQKNYELIGQTKDDAVGEAYDKVARMLGLPYPGGPEVSKLAEAFRTASSNQTSDVEIRTSDVLISTSDYGLRKSIIGMKLPRPMLHDASCDFSFSGLKTAVLYLIKARESLTDQEKEQLSAEFEDAVAEVLWKKTARALEQTGARTLVLGGGVSANTNIRREFRKNIDTDYSEIALRIPSAALTTDNAIMIGIAGYFHARSKNFAAPEILRANGNLSLT